MGQADTLSDLGAAYAHCLALARSHYENFPTASGILLGKKLAAPVAAIYAFSRTADDFADEPGEGTKEERLAKLARWEKHLEAAFAGKPDHPIFLALADTAKNFNLSIDLFRALLSAFKQDVLKSRYETPAEMLDYCTRSANPVGRLVLRLHGYNDPALDARSDAICTALQLANFWQDVAIDLEKDRIYLPQSEMKRFGVTEESLRARKVDESYQKLLAQECARARALFDEGAVLPSMVRGRLALWLRCVWLGGTKILAGVGKAGYDVFRKRPTLSTFDKISILLKALAGWVFHRPALPAAAPPRTAP